MYLTRLGLRTERQCYACPNAVAIAAGTDQFESEPVVAGLAFISEERYCAIQLCDEQICVAIVIVISEEGTATDSRMFIKSDLSKRAIALIPEELIRLLV